MHLMHVHPNYSTDQRKGKRFPRVIRVQSAAIDASICGIAADYPRAIGNLTASISVHAHAAVEPCMRLTACYRALVLYHTRACS